MCNNTYIIYIYIIGYIGKHELIRVFQVRLTTRHQLTNNPQQVQHGLH